MKQLSIKSIAFLESMRPLTTLLGLAGAYIGGIVAGAPYISLPLLLAMIVVFLVGAVLIAVLDRVAARYGLTGRGVSLYLLYASIIGIGYGTSGLWRGLQFAAALLLFAHFFLFERKRPTCGINKPITPRRSTPAVKP